MEMNRDAAEYLVGTSTELLWQMGCIGDWYLKPKQKTVLDFLNVTRDPFFEASRRYGKTNTILTFDCEQSIIRPGIITRWCEPWKYQCREIVMPEMEQIQRSIPKRYRFTWHQTDSYYENEYSKSRIYLRGVNEDKGESARGTAAHIIVCDELGSWRDPEYIINNALRPQTLTTKGNIIRSGTPPRNLLHAYYKMKAQAELAGRFVQRLIYDQELVEWEEIERQVAEMGGWEAVSVLREYLCQKVIDTNFAIIPEWKEEYVKEVPRDDLYRYYLKYDSLDIGVRDLTVCLVAYYDFKRAALIVLDEVILTGPAMTTEKLAELTREKETHYFGVKWERTEKDGRVRWKALLPPDCRLRRVSDIDLRLVNDMIAQGLYFDPTDKGYLEEMVNAVRIMVGAGKLFIHPRCVNLIDCMKYGLWDEHRKDWERDEKLGHFDALASLMYLVRNVDTKTNPIPAEHGRPPDDWFFTKEKESKDDDLLKIFNIKRHGRIT